MSKTFEYHEFNDSQQSCSDGLRIAAESLESCIKVYCPVSREKSLAMTNLEQAVMWANKAIAIHGVKE